MNAGTSLSARDIKQGLQRCRVLAKQDVVAAAGDPELARAGADAEVRRRLYQELADLAETCTPDELVSAAVARYMDLPVVPQESRAAHAQVVAEEEALENFFVMVGLDPELRTYAWRVRPRIIDEPLAVS